MVKKSFNTLLLVPKIFSVYNPTVNGKLDLFCNNMLKEYSKLTLLFVADRLPFLIYYEGLQRKNYITYFMTTIVMHREVTFNKNKNWS